MPTGQTTFGRKHRRDLERIQKLEDQFQAYCLKLQNAQSKIHQFTAEIRQATQEMLNLDHPQSPAERSYLDVFKNHGRHPNARRYSIDTLMNSTMD
jgi:DNA repair ATPase RecN